MNGTLTHPRSRPLAAAIAMAIVILAASVPFLSTLHDYFLADDFGVVQLLAQKPALQFPKWFYTTWMDNIWGFTPDEIRPFPAVSYQLTALWGADSPVANHVLNIALHVLNALLVFGIGLRVARLSLFASSAAGVLFAVLPMHAEAVVWVTGRVDSIPTFFYLTSFLAYALWRQGGRQVLFWVSVATFFCALFSKQTAITMLATLLLYDILIERRPLRISWAMLRTYAPFVLLTGGYLLLRYYLFNQAIRESALSAQTALNFGGLQFRHLQKLILGSVSFGREGLSPSWSNAAFAVLAFTGFAILLVLVYRIYAQQREPVEGRPGTGSLLLYFGPIWWLIGTAPTFVANYESARHLYLGSVGYAIAAGVLLDVLWTNRRRALKYACVLIAVALVAVYTSRLQLAVSEWSKAAFLSQKVTADVARFAEQIPPGSLLIIDPAVSLSPSANSPYPENLWAWAIPFAMQPPFTSTDLTQRISVISPVHIHCCDIQWYEFTRNNLARWAAHPEAPPWISLRWTEAGEVVQHSEDETTRLRERFLKLQETATREELIERFYALIHELRAS